MEPAGSSETLVTACDPTRYGNLNAYDLNFYRHESLKACFCSQDPRLSLRFSSDLVNFTFSVFATCQSYLNVIRVVYKKLGEKMNSMRFIPRGSSSSLRLETGYC
jgi:hypothetical protein